MYEAKGRGKAQSVSYEPAIGRARLERLELVEELRRAIEQRRDRGRLPAGRRLRDTGRIAGVEALARWRLHGADVPTEVFIRIAEDTGLVVPLGESVLETVARDAHALREAAGGPISISVNVSVRAAPRARVRRHASQRAVQAMERTGLVLEITERQGIGDDPDGARGHAHHLGDGRAVRDRRLRGRLLLDQLPAGPPRAHHQGRRHAVPEHRPRRARLRRAAGDRGDGRGARPRRRGRGHRAGRASSRWCATTWGRRTCRASSCTGRCRSSRLLAVVRSNRLPACPAAESDDLAGGPGRGAGPDLLTHVPTRSVRDGRPQRDLRERACTARGRSPARPG